MWVAKLFPELFLHAIAMATLYGGLALLILSFFIRWIPRLSNFRVPVRIISVLLILLGCYNYGVYDTEMHWQDKLAKAKEEYEKKLAASQATNVVIKKEYITKNNVIKEQEVVFQDRIIEIEKIINRECRVPREAIELLNQASAYPIDNNKK